MASTGGDRTLASIPDRYRVLLEIGRSLTGTLSLEELYEEVYRETSRVIEAAGFYIALYDEEDDVATVVFYADRGETREASISYRGSDSAVIRSGQGSIVDDRLEQESLLVIGDEASDVTRSAISAPLRHTGRVIGAISAQSYRRKAYSPGDLELLQGIADIAAVATENARYVQELEKRRKEAERIEEIGRLLASSREWEDLLGQVTRAARELMEVGAASVWLREGDSVRIAASDGHLALPAGTTFPWSDRLSETFQDSDQPLIVKEISSSPILPASIRERVRSESALLVPLVAAGKPLGVLAVGHGAGREYTDDESHLLQRLASQAALALENAKLHADLEARSLTDPLTGLPNRRHLQMHLDRELAAAFRGRRLSVVLFDLDNFKEYNDTLGHLAGDRVLREVGRILAEETRAMNLAARFGGDEFISVLSDTDPEGAQLHATRVAARIATAEELAPHEITVSFGLAHFTAGMKSVDDLIGAADDALYRQKDSRGS